MELAYWERAESCAPSMISGEPTHQEMTKGIPVGKCFTSVEVNRHGEGHWVHLGHFHQSDGPLCFCVFADEDAGNKDSKTVQFAE